MSGFETLPPDQRAVLQLILAQGRGYAELAQLLKIDPAAVRTRAHAGLDALATTSAPDGEQRARIADYLLGQQDEGERLVTLVALGESPDASAWAAALRAQLTPLARDPLPEVPETAHTNGTAPAIASPPATVAPPASATPVATPAPPATVQPFPVAAPPPEPTAPAALTAEPAAAAAPPSEPPAATTRSSTAPRPSRLGGAILLAAVVALVVVLVVVLTGGDSNDTPSTTPAASTPAQTTGQTTTSGSQPSGQVVAQVNLLATPAGGQATGIGLVEQAGGKQAIAIQAQKLPANGTHDIYAAWIQGSPGVKLLGFVQRQVKANGSFSVAADMPSNARSYQTLLITRETAKAGAGVPTQPGATILRGTFQFR